MAAIETSRRITVEVNGVDVRARGRVAAPADPLPPRRRRPHRQPHRLRHRQLRRVQRHPRRRAREELHAARRPGRRREHPHRRGPRRGRRALGAAAGVQRPPRAAVRLLHAGDARGRDAPARAQPAAERRGDPQGPPGQHLPLHRLLEHRRRGQGRVRPGGERHDRDVVAPERVEVEAPAEPEPWKGQSIPRKEDRRLVQGQGVFVDDIKRHNMGFAHYVRSPYAHAVITLDRRLEGARAAGRVRHAHGRRGRDADRSVLPALDAARARRSRTTRWPSAACASPATRSRSSSPRRASSRATRPSSSRSSTSRST